MADQKEFKKRLKALMNRPENQVCSDCTERSPRWASLIVPPPDAPPGSQKIGSFCCLECSGSHRRLGVHITFVRSVNLDSWKEEEVRMMENGGNGKVNAIFEARLAQSGVPKPTNHADLQTRERFIRDKYERRKFYDPAAFSTYQQQAAAASAAPDTSHHFEADFGNALFSPVAAAAPVATSIGPPSDAARRRLEARGKTTTSAAVAGFSDSFSSDRGKSPKRGARRTKSSDGMPRLAAAPVSAPVMMDLLDFQSDNALSHNGFVPPAAPAPAAAPVDLFDFAPVATAALPQPSRSRSPAPPAGSSSGRRRGDSRTKSSERKPEGGRSLRRSNSSEKLPIREPPRRTRSSEKLESPRRSKSSEKQPSSSSSRPAGNNTAAAADILALYSSPTPRQSFATTGNAPMNAMPMNPMNAMQGMNPMQNMNQMQAMMQSMNVSGNGMMSGISSLGNGLPVAPNLMGMPQPPTNPAMMQQQYQQQQQQQMRLYQQQQMMMMQQRSMPNMYAQSQQQQPNVRMGMAKPKKVVDPNDPFADCSGDFSTDFSVNQFR